MACVYKSKNNWLRTETGERMLEQYKTIMEGGTGEITEKKSRFIATVRPVST